MKVDLIYFGPRDGVLYIYDTLRLAEKELFGGLGISTKMVSLAALITLSRCFFHVSFCSRHVQPLK